MTALYAGVPLGSISALRTTGVILCQAHVELFDRCSTHLENPSVRLRHLLGEIKQMLDLKQENRPTATDLGFSIHIISQLEPENTPLYGACCAPAASAVCDHLTDMERLGSEITALKNLHRWRNESMESQLAETTAGRQEGEAEKERLTKQVHRPEESRSGEGSSWPSRSISFLNVIGNGVGSYCDFFFPTQPAGLMVQLWPV